MNSSVSYVLNQVGIIYQIAPDRIESLLRAQPELWRQIVVGAYLDDEISLSKAAELLGMDFATLRTEFLRQGVPLKLGPATKEEALEELI